MSEHSIIKKKKKKTDQERSGGKAAYHETQDDEQQIEDDNTGAQSRPHEEGLMSATTMDQKMELLIDIVTSNSYAVQQLSDQMSSFDDRLRTLEVSRRLSKGTGYYTPRREKKNVKILTQVARREL